MSESSPEQQLQQLEREYQRRRSEIEQAAPSPEQAPETTHETASRVTEEAIQQQVPAFQASSHTAAVSDELSEEEKTTVQGWVNLVFTKSLSEGIKTAQAAGDPALLDAFHAALTGVLHGRLVSDKKLQEVN